MRILIALAAALLVAAPSAQAQVPAGTTGVQLVEQRALTHPGARVAVADGRVYVATEGRTGSAHFPHTSTFQVLDGGAIDLNGANPRDLAVQGGYGYVATGPDEGTQMEGGLRVIDARDPASPRQVGVVRILVPDGQTVAWATGVALQGDIAYVAHTGGVEVVDVANPAAPAIVTRVQIPGGANDVVTSNGRLYATDARGLRIYSLTDPRQPALIGTYESPDVSTAAATGVVAVADTWAYLARYDALIAIDLGIPTAPDEVSRVGIPAGATSISFADSHLYVALGDAGLAVVNVSRTALPRPLLVSTALGPTRDAVLANGTLYVANGGGLALARYPATVYRQLLPVGPQSAGLP
jgi:hypothetical protein